MNPDLAFRITASGQTAGAFSATRTEIDRVSRSLAQANREAVLARGAMGALNVGALALRTAIGSLGAALAGGLTGKLFLDHTIEQEKVMAQLNAAIVSTGAAAGYTAKELADLAASMQRQTTYGDEAIAGAEALLLTFTRIGHDVFPTAVSTILDVATALGTDLQSAAKMVGRALNDPTQGLQALSRAGIQFSAGQKRQIQGFIDTNQLAKAQAAILAELETRFGGSARAARDTLGGALAALKNSFGDLFEVSGDGSAELVQSINRITEAISSPELHTAIENFGSSLFNSFADTINFLKDNQWAIPIIGGAMAGGAVGGPTGAVVGAVAAAGAEVGSSLGGPTSELIYSLFPKAAAIRDQRLGAAAKSNLTTQLNSMYADEAWSGPNAGGAADVLKNSRNNDLTNSVADQAAAFAKLTQSLKDQIAALGMSERAQFVANEVAKLGTKATQEQKDEVTALAGALYDQKAASEAAVEAQKELIKRMDNVREVAKDALGTFVSDLREGKSATEALNDAVGRLLDSIINSGLDQLIAALFGPTGTSGGGLLGGIVSALLGGGSSAGASANVALGGLFAKGGVFSGGNVVPFASGGIVSRPTVFPFASGIGLMGEAGPEAIMPLRRGPDGRLGVASGAGPGNRVVVQNVVNNNSSAEVSQRRERTPDGVRIVTDIVERHIAKGGLDKPLGARYGVGPRKSFGA